MTEELNLNAIIGLAAATAMVQSGYHRDTSAEYLENTNGWDSVIDLTFTYLKWVGLNTNNTEIDKYVIAECFWGMDEDSLDETLAECHKEEEEDFSST